MIHIHMKRWVEGMELEAFGHAAHGAIGHDIVCAGVSALLYSLAAYLEKRASICPTGHLDRTECEGGMYLRTTGIKEDEEAFAVIAAGLTLMAKAFPEEVRFTPPAECVGEKEETDGRTEE